MWANVIFFYIVDISTEMPLKTIGIPDGLFLKWTKKNKIMPLRYAKVCLSHRERFPEIQDQLLKNFINKIFVGYQYCKPCNLHTNAGHYALRKLQLFVTRLSGPNLGQVCYAYRK